MKTEAKPTPLLRPFGMVHSRLVSSRLIQPVLVSTVYSLPQQPDIFNPKLARLPSEYGRLPIKASGLG